MIMFYNSDYPFLVVVQICEVLLYFQTLVFSDIPSAGCRPPRYTECCCSKVIKGSSGLLYARSYSDPTDHNDSRS